MYRIAPDSRRIESVFFEFMKRKMEFAMRLANRHLLLAVSGLAVLSLLLAAVVSLRGEQVHANGTALYSATKGMLTPVGTVSPMRAPGVTAVQPSTKSPAKGARLLQAANKADTLTRQGSNQPSGNGLPLDNQHPGAVLHNFNGVSSLDSEVTNFGAEFEPPDQGLCAGNGFVLEPVNSAYTIYRTNGAVVAGPFNVNVLFDEGLTEFTSDPRCHYDQATNTWFASILFISGGGVGNSSHTDISVNTSGDPTTPWTVYRIDTTDASGPGCPCFGDQPRLGIDANNIYISTDEFSILGPQLNGTQIYAVSKSDLVHHRASIHFVHFGNLSDAGIQAFGVQPALTYGHADAEYFLNSLDPNGTTDDRLGVWALTDGDAVARGDIPKLSNVVINSETYGLPPNAVQRGSTSLITTDDDRMQQVEYIDGHIWGELSTIFTFPSDSTPVTAAAWFEVVPHLHGQAIGGADIRTQGYVASEGNFLYYPALSVDSNGNAAMVMTLSGTRFFPSAAYAILQSGHSSFGRIRIVGLGTGPYDPNGTRWGDYSWAVLDPSLDAFWLATEYIPPVASQTTDRLVNWGTRVFEVAASS
jgi:hypothetical protein